MRDASRWILIIVGLAIAGGGFYLHYQNSQPCAQPILYSIGSVDPRFGTTDSILLSEATSAAAIWNKAEGRTILAYDPASNFKINLIYDAREANAKLGVQITQKQADEDAARAALDASQAQYVSEQTAYNQEVSAINVRGGATESEAAALATQRAELSAQADSLNSRVAIFNASVTSLNTVVNEYNQTAGHTFEEGEYVRDSSGERINIFEFVGNLQLERVLAHELGHAIGLGHNTNPKSIMFAENESGNLSPTEADLSALHAICGA